MIDREKVRKGIDICLSRFHCGEDCPYYNAGITECMESLQKDTLELLEEQEPIRPKKWIPKGQILARVRGYYCPVCDTGISQGDRFCHRCGRALKWDEGTGH